MIIIPEREMVLISPPRTASGAARRAITARYPKSIVLYHHMEADGVPHGYDHFQRIGVVRNPIVRLWSLYKYLKDFSAGFDLWHIAEQRHSVEGLDFEEWLLKNRAVFTNPFGQERYIPQYAVKHMLPETRKSQFIYLRPDLGTKIIPFGHLRRLEIMLDIKLSRINATNDDDDSSYLSDAPKLSSFGANHIERYFRWDLDASAKAPEL